MGGQLPISLGPGARGISKAEHLLSLHSYVTSFKNARVAYVHRPFALL